MRPVPIMGAVAALAASPVAAPGESRRAPVEEIAITHQPALVRLGRGGNEGYPPASINYRRKGKKAWKALRRIRG